MRRVWVGPCGQGQLTPQEGCSEQMLFWATHAHHLREGLGGGEATHLVPPHTLLDLGGQRNIAQNFLIAILFFVFGAKAHQSRNIAQNFLIAIFVFFWFLVRSPPEPQCCGKKQSE